MKEYYYEKLLNIKTSGRQKGDQQSIHYHPYEPTPYHALEELFKHHHVDKTDHIVDFGSGKGRLNFYINYFYGASVVGVEVNEVFYRCAIENYDRYKSNSKIVEGTIEFQCCLAEEYKIRAVDNRFYFFNPFSIHIFKKIISNIMISLEKLSRPIEIVLYYPSEEYIYFLENQTAFHLEKEITIPNYYEKDENDRFLIYHFG